MPELRNLIVTCGTSQTLRGKLDNEPMKLYDEAYQSFEKKLKPVAGLDDPGLLDTPEAILQQDRILRVLAANWDQRKSTLGKLNCFSAEISTLTALQKLHNGLGWVPASDRVVLLSSDTLAGQFNARILRRALIEIWNVPDGHVKLVVVPGLTENPANADTAMGQLAEQITENLLENEGDFTWRNIFVATGGFKSCLPSITIFSIVFGIEMVYLFEQSEHLQSLSPHLKDDEARQYWEDTWKKMAKKGWLSAMMPSYLRLALTERLTRKPKQAKKY